jgi:hypothetical protein
MIRAAVLVGGLALSVMGAAMVLVTLLQIALLMAATGDASCLWCVARDALNDILNGLGALGAGALGLGGAMGGPLRDAARSAYDGLGAMGRGAVAAGGAALGAADAIGDTIREAGGVVNDAARDAARSAYDAGADAVGDAMTPDYVPGTSPVPQPGDTYYFPGMGKATVKSVDHHSGDGGMFRPSSNTTIHTDQGTVQYGEIGGEQYGQIRW